MVHKYFRGQYLVEVVVFLVATLLSILPAPTASAATSCQWTSQTTATCNGEAFTGSVSSSKETLIGKTVSGGNDGGSCFGQDSLVVTKPASATSGQLTIWTMAAATGKFGAPQCSSTTSTAPLSGNWSLMAGNPSGGCSGISQAGVACNKIPLGCPGSTVQGPISTQATLTCPYTPTAGSGWKCSAKECDFTNPTIAVKGGQGYPTCPSGATLGSGGSCTCSDGSTATNGACPNADAQNCGGGGFDWAICPADTLFQNMAQQLLQFIQSILTINTTGSGGIFGSGANGTAYYRAWNTFRILGTALIVIAGLIMVASQAFGLELLDAYTIRKVLPRLLVAIIGMSLSWPLLSFTINFFNTLGADIQGLMYAPFSTLPNHAQLTDGVISWGFVAVIVGLMAAGFGGVLMPILGTGLLALLLAVTVLIVRQIGVTLLVIVAPFAIAAYVLPNTKKAWDLWKDNFLGLMFMYPIVMMLIAAGEIFSAVGKTGGTAQQIVGIVAFYVPYFMIPLAFRMATGMISTISGMVHERGKGAFGRLAQARQNKMKGSWEDLQHGNRFKNADKDSVRGRMNKYMGRAANANQAFKAGVGYNPRNWRKNMAENMGSFESRHEKGAVAEFLEKNEAFGMNKGNEDMLRAARESGGDEEKYKTRMRAFQDEYGKQAYDDEVIQQSWSQFRAARRGVSADVFNQATVMGEIATGTGLKVEKKRRAITDNTGQQLKGTNGKLRWQYLDENNQVVAQTNNAGELHGIGDKTIQDAAITGGGAGEMYKLINEEWGKDRVGAVSALVTGRQLAGQARRFDISGGSTGAAIGHLNATYAYDVTVAQQKATGATDAVAVAAATAAGGQDTATATKATIREALQGQGGQYIAAARKSAVEGFSSIIKEDLGKSMSADLSSDGAWHDSIRQLANLGGRYDAIASSQPENVDELEPTMAATFKVSTSLANRLNTAARQIHDSDPRSAGTTFRPILAAGQDISNRQALEYAREYIPGFLDRRREISRNGLQNAATVAAAAAGLGGPGAGGPNPGPIDPALPGPLAGPMPH